MDDETILARGGDERDIEEYAKQNGADLTEEDVEKMCACGLHWGHTGKHAPHA